MSAIIHNSFRKFNADNFIDFIDGTPKVLYLGIGKTTPWAGNSVGEYVDGTYSDLAIPVPIDTTVAPFLHYADLLAVKKITSPSVSHVLKRVNWTSGEVYAEYNHFADDIIDGIMVNGEKKEFFVMTDQYNVYKCISNYNGAASIVKPTNKSTGIIETADNYRWKFMFEIQQADVLTFVTPDWIPVNSPATANQPDQENVETNATTKDGSLEQITVTAGGTNYRSHTGTSPEFGTLNTIKLAVGSGNHLQNEYYTGLTVYIKDGTGSGQTLRTITAYDGATQVATVTPNWGSGLTPGSTSVYEVMPKITLSGSSGSSGAEARVSSVDVNGVIKKVSMSSAGTLYRSATATVSSGGGTDAILLPIISPVGGHGSNAVSELGGAYVMLNTRLIGYEDGIIPIGEDGDFRKVHLISSPMLTDGVTPASASVIVGSGLKAGSGDIIYSEFRAPINRAADSTEDIKLVVEF